MKQKFTIQSESVFYNNETINILYLENKTTKYTLYQKESENDTHDETLFTKFEFDDSFQIAPKKKFSNITFLFFKDDSTNMFQVKYNNKFLYYQVDTSVNFIYNSSMNVLQADGTLYTKKNTLTKTLNIFDNTPVVKENSVEKLIENELNYVDNSLSSETLVTEPVVEEPVTEPVVEEPVTEPVVEEPVTETVIEEPVTETVVEEPVTETVIEEPVTEPVTETVIEEPVTEPVTETVIEEPVTETVVEEPVTEHVTEPVVEETVTETVVEEPVTETVVEEPVTETVIEEPVVEEPVVEETSVENLKHKKVTFKESDDKNSFTFKNIIEDFIILDKAISKSIEEKINLANKVNIENTINQNKITYTHNNVNYNLYSTKLTPIKQNTNLTNQVIEKSNIFTNYDNSIELDNKNMNYLILFNKTKYLVNKKDTNLTFINLQNKNIISINNKEYFKLENVNYLLTNNSTLIIPVENKRLFDNNNGTSYNVLIPKSSI
jgi:hypothetical protein